MKSMSVAILVSVLTILAFWLVGQALGFNVSLLGSVGLTIALTVVMNLVLAGFASRGRRPSAWR